MISIQEIEQIAHEHCDGDILDQSIESVMAPSSKFPISWIFTILHEDYDGNVFETTIEISRNGSIWQWFQQLVSEKSD
jgi:hypothetical protein